MKAYPTVLLPLVRNPTRAAGRVDSYYYSAKNNDRGAREEILRRAYLLWQNEGCPQNRALAHWLRAEVEVARDGSPAPGTTPEKRYFD